MRSAPSITPKSEVFGSRGLTRTIDDTSGKLPKELVAYFAPEEEFVGVAVEKKAEARVEPRLPEKLEISKGSFEVETRKRGQRFVEFIDASAVVETIPFE